MASVGGFFKTVGKIAFPFLSTAAVAGGPWTAMAAQAIGKGLGLTEVAPTTEAIEKAMENATLDPSTRLQLQKAEQDFKLQVEQLTNERIKTVQDFEAHLAQIDAEDRASARNREIQVRDNTPKILAYGVLTLALSVTVLVAVAFISGKPSVKDVTVATMLGTVIGYVFSEVKQVFSYYFGSSAGSERKTELLAQAPAIENPKGDTK